MEIINQQIQLFLQEPDQIAALANISACIMQSYDRLNWAGFYLVKNQELILGPFQGRPACIHIPFVRGVCGAAWRTKKVQNIGDVLNCQDHIACDTASRSELCVPILIDETVAAEIDLDSPVCHRFGKQEEQQMQQAADDLSAAWLIHHWPIYR